MSEQKKTDTPETTAAQKPIKPHVSSYDSLAAVWTVLSEYSSREKPMSVSDIQSKLRDRVNAPSVSTLKRILANEQETMNTLFPGYVLRTVGAPPPSYDTISELLKGVEDAPELVRELLPVQLRCVAARGNGRSGYEPYEAALERQEAKKGGQGKSTNNIARRYYLESVLSPAQWRILTDMIKVYPYIGEKQTRTMLDALGKVFPGCKGEVGSRFSFKKENEKLFENLSALDVAVRARRRVVITYGEYTLNAAGKPVLKVRENNGRMEFEPYALMWSNGYYYAVGKNRGMMNLRVDRILDVKLLAGDENVFTVPEDFDPVLYRDKSPVMYPGEAESIRLRCPRKMLSVVMDFFGEQARFIGVDAETMDVLLRVAPAGAKLFIMQYADRVEVLEPETLRTEVEQTLRAALEKYQTREERT